MTPKSSISAICVLLVSGMAFFAGRQAGAEGDATAGGEGIKHVKIFAIGNSFSKNATKYLAEIAKSADGRTLKFSHANIGGCSLEKHYTLAMKHEKDPKDPEGMPYYGRALGLKEMLTAEKWDYVTIQQCSPDSVKIDTYRPYAKQLCDYIHMYAPQAEIVFHQTWAYRSDDKNAPSNMYAQLTMAYHTIAAEIGIRRIIPVGDAFQYVAESPDWHFIPDKEFNFKAANYPQLPNEPHSLHVGCFWNVKGDQKKLAYDTHHANVKGEYLGGCVWFEFFYGADVRKATFKPPELSDADAAFLREVAHKIVSEGVKPAAWPLGASRAAK